MVVRSDNGDRLSAAAAGRQAEIERADRDPTRTDRPMVDRLIDAAAICVRRKGFDATSLEEIAAEARVSRTSLYRHFPNREGLYKALLVKRAEPFSRWSMDIVTGGGDAPERLETIVTGAVIEARQVGWLRAAIGPGLTPPSVALFRAAGREAAARTLSPLLRAMMDDRAREAGLTVDHLLDWLIAQIIALAQDDASSEHGIRMKVRYFILSVIAPQAVLNGALHERLESIERRLDSLTDYRTIDDTRR